MPTLFKRSNGIYYIVYQDDDGRRKWISTNERKKSAAVKNLLDFTSTLRKPTPKISPREFISEFLSFGDQF